MQAKTKDTKETVTVPATVERDVYGEGYDWMANLTGTSWNELSAWGRDGWDLGSWPYVISAVAQTEDEQGKLFGYCTYVEGDVATRWYRTRDARSLAISKEAYWYWASGQADGPEALQELNPQEFHPIDGLCEPFNPSRAK
ncbi:hypothetical protein [Glutamicibacter ardleyensis]|uniref:hypothetical protein n=1 Tax=Glutamicibacter ardleyensis TaxID=225894 RepID=UPI003FD315E8